MKESERLIMKYWRTMINGEWKCRHQQWNDNNDGFSNDGGWNMKIMDQKKMTDNDSNEENEIINSNNEESNEKQYINEEIWR